MPDFAGRATYYDVGLGECGIVNKADDLVVALNAAQFGNGYPGPHCGKKIKITYQGKSVIATIVDRAPGAPFAGLDLSKGAFRALAPLKKQALDVRWQFTS
ncbi:Papain inhibitor [Streptomyces alboniger]